MTIIKFRSGSNQPGSEVSHLKKSTVEQVMKSFTSYQRHYFLIHDFLSYSMGEMLSNFVGKRMRYRPETDRFSDLRPKLIESNIFGDIAGNTFLKGYFQKLSDKSEEQY